MIETLESISTILLILSIFFIYTTHKSATSTLTREAAANFAMLCSVLFIFSMIITLGSLHKWNAAKHQANIVNKEYGTNFTQAELYYTSDVIEILKQQSRNRSEIKLKVK